MRDTGAWEEWVLFLLNGIGNTARETIDLVQQIQNLVMATKYLEELIEKGMLTKQKVGRDNYYINAPLCDVLIAFTQKT